MPTTLDASFFSVIDVHGRKQLTYKGWPLYYFGADAQIRGNTKGVSVPSPGIWPVAVKDIAAAKPTTVVEVVVNSESHNTLEAAVIAAGLGGTLSGEGPFTVFAPTDAAFAALPAGTVEALLADPSGALTDILKYHVLAGKVLSTDLSNGMSATTLLGKNIKVTINANGVFINGAKVTVADIVTGNGVVHVIDAVLLPKTTVVDVIVNSENHTTLEAAVVAAGLAETLAGDGPFTVFAPTDAAFAALPAGTIEALLADPSGALTDILKYHVIAGKVMSSNLSNSQVVTTLSGKFVTVSINANGIFINQSKVIVANIETDNGVVHVLDVVLVPLTPTSSVEISKGEQIFRIYPNPASSNLTIDLDEDFELDSKLTVSITRLDGRIMVEIPANNSRLSYNVGNLSPGMYLVSVTKNGRKQTEKLIVK